MEVFDIIDVSSSSADEKDNDDCLIISRSDAVSPPRNNNNSSSTSREAGIKKEEDQVAAVAVVDAVSSHNKRRRRSSRKAVKKTECQSAAELNAASAAYVAATLAAAAATYYKTISRLVEIKKKKALITVGKKIPPGVLRTITTKGSINFNMHRSLAHKRVFFYGLPAYKTNPVAISTVSKEFMDQCAIWRPFFQNSFVKPVLDFLKRADYLKETGVAETVIFSATGQGLMFSFDNAEIRKRMEYLAIVTDYVNRYLHALGMDMDIPQKGMPPRSRWFILLVDNLKVKFVRIESSDGNFTIPSNEEIIKAFDQ